MLTPSSPNSLLPPLLSLAPGLSRGPWQLVTLGPNTTSVTSRSRTAVLSVDLFSQIQEKPLVELEATVNSSWRDEETTCDRAQREDHLRTHPVGEGLEKLRSRLLAHLPPSSSALGRGCVWSRGLSPSLPLAMYCTLHRFCPLFAFSPHLEALTTSPEHSWPTPTPKCDCVTELRHLPLRLVVATSQGTDPQALPCRRQGPALALWHLGVPGVHAGRGHPPCKPALEKRQKAPERGRNGGYSCSARFTDWGPILAQGIVDNTDLFLTNNVFIIFFLLIILTNF